MRLAFVVESAVAPAAGVAGGVVGGFEEPGFERYAGCDAIGVAREGDEDGLGDVVGEGVIADLPEGGGVNEVDMGVDKAAEGVFVAVVEEAAEKRGGIHGY